MRDISSVSIEEIIIHILDPFDQGLILSNVTLPIEDNQALQNYFSNHIVNSLRERASKPARFRNINPEQPSGVCRDLLRRDVPLVEGSQRMAEALYGIMEEDRRITPGDLAVCLFRADNYPYTHFLAILKIDPSQIFRHVIREDDLGNVYVSFEADQHGFTTEKLQKCAFIQPLEPRHPEYDMLLLDRQRWDTEDRTVARFFSETFLDAQESYDARKYTENLYRGLVNAQNLVRDQLNDEQEQQLDASISGAVSRGRMNLDSWLNELPLADNVKQEIDRSISTTITEREFPVDRRYSERLMRKVKFRGDYDLKVELDSQNYFQVIVSEEHITDDPDRPPYYRIVIETDEWRRVA